MKMNVIVRVGNYGYQALPKMSMMAVTMIETSFCTLSNSLSALYQTLYMHKRFFGFLRHGLTT
jgi:hypothetical protein